MEDIRSTRNDITFFTQLYYPDTTTTAIIMTDLAEDLVSYGFNVKVVCIQPSYLVAKRCFKNEVHSGVSIRRLWSLLFSKNKNIGRILTSSSCFLTMFLALFFIPRKEFLLFNTNPAMLPFLGTFAGKLRRQKYAILIHDLWPELPAHIGMITKRGFLYKLIDRLLLSSYRHAQRIIVLSEAMKRRLTKKVPEKAKNIHVIPNWADEKRIYPVGYKENKLLKELGFENKKIVMYSGNLGRYQPLEVIVESAFLLKNREDIVFVFAGNGGKKKKLRDKADKLCLKNIKFIPFQPINRLAASLSMAYISLLGIMPENDGVIMPSKLYGLLAVGRPIICISSADSEVARIVKQAGAGIQTSLEDPGELANKVVMLIDHPEKSTKMGRNGRIFFQKHFERKIVTKAWGETIHKMACKRR